MAWAVLLAFCGGCVMYGIMVFNYGDLDTMAKWLKEPYFWGVLGVLRWLCCFDVCFGMVLWHEKMSVTKGILNTNVNYEIGGFISL